MRVRVAGACANCAKQAARVHLLLLQQLSQARRRSTLRAHYGEYAL